MTFRTRLYWDGRKGSKTFEGQWSALHAAPVVPGIPQMWAVDYAPEAFVATIRAHSYDGWRDLSAAECRLISAFLRGVGLG